LKKKEDEGKKQEGRIEKRLKKKEDKGRKKEGRI